MAKAAYQNSFDSEGRKLGEQTGLDTPGSPSRKQCALGVSVTTRN